MSNNAPLGRLVSRIAGAIHPRMNSLDERSTRALFNALTSSFESRFNELYPGPQSQLHPSGSPYSLANRHFESITSHPIFTSSPQADALKRSLDAQIAKLADSAQSAFQDVLDKSKTGTLDDKAVRKSLKHILTSSSNDSEPITLTQLLNHLHAHNPSLLVSLIDDKTLSRRIVQLLTRSPNHEAIWHIFNNISNPGLIKAGPSLFARYLSASLNSHGTWFALQQIERALSSVPWFSPDRARTALLQLATYILRNPSSGTALWKSPISLQPTDPMTLPLKLAAYLGPQVSSSAEAHFLNATLWLVSPDPDVALALQQIALLQNDADLLAKAKTRRKVQFPYVHLCLKTLELLVKQERYTEAESLLKFAGQSFPIFAHQEQVTEHDAEAKAASGGEYKLAVIRLCLTFVEQLISKQKYLEAQRIMLFARESFPDMLDGLSKSDGRRGKDGAMVILEGILPT